VVFYFVDKKFGKAASDELNGETYTNKFSVIGRENFLWLLIIIISVFLDPNVLEWVPAIYYDGLKFSFIRETIMLSVAFLSYRFADEDALKANEFNFEPNRAVAVTFIRVSGAMMSAVGLVGNVAEALEASASMNSKIKYRGTPVVSGPL